MRKLIKVSEAEMAGKVGKAIHKKGHEIEQRHVDGMYLDSLQY